MLTGHALLRPGVTPLRLAISRQQSIVLDRTIHLVNRGNVVATHSPVHVPLVYEEAVGGPGREDNPAGNAAPRTSTRRAPTAPRALRADPARSWPARNRLLGGLNRRAIDGRAPRPAAGVRLELLPSRARPSSYIPYLQGDEWVLLEWTASDGRRREVAAPADPRRRRGLRRAGRAQAPLRLQARHAAHRRRSADLFRRVPRQRAGARGCCLLPRSRSCRPRGDRRSHPGRSRRRRRWPRAQVACGRWRCRVRAPGRRGAAHGGFRITDIVQGGGPWPFAKASSRESSASGGRDLNQAAAGAEPLTSRRAVGERTGHARAPKGHEESRGHVPARPVARGALRCRHSRPWRLRSSFRRPWSSCRRLSCRRPLRTRRRPRRPSLSRRRRSLRQPPPRLRLLYRRRARSGKRRSGSRPLRTTSRRRRRRPRRPRRAGTRPPPRPCTAGSMAGSRRRRDKTRALAAPTIRDQRIQDVN